MRIKLLKLIVLWIPFIVNAYEFDQPGVSSSCLISLSMKLQRVRSDATSGSAILEVFLREKNGNPIEGKKIEMSSSWGVFYCSLPSQVDSTGVDPTIDRSCYITDQKGKIKVYLENLNLDESVDVEAKCDCGGYYVKAKGKLIPKKAGKKK